MLDFGQFDFGQFDFGRLAEIELPEVEIGRTRNWLKSNRCFFFSLFLLLLPLLYSVFTKNPNPKP